MKGSFDKPASKGLATEITTMTRMHLKPRLIFDRCVDFLIQRHVELPTARRLTLLKKLSQSTSPAKIKEAVDDLAATASEAGWRDILKARSLKLQNRLNPLLRALHFMPNKRAAALLDTIDHFTADGDVAANHAPIGFLDAGQKAALVRTDGTFRVSLYKVFLFQAVTIAIKSGALNVEQIYNYRPMDAYLIEKERW